MSEIQWPHTLHLLQNPEKIVCSGFQNGVSDLACNDSILNSGCSDSKTRDFGFY
jgi:hypothetical protein